MADAMVENRPAVRFFCHRCNMEFEDVLQDYTCPYCASGFIEQLENGAERVSLPGQTFSDANMSNINDTNNIDEAFLNSTDRSIFPLNNVPPVLRDIAFLMSGGRLRGATRQQPLIGEMEIGFTLSGGRGAAPPGTVTAGAPLVLLGPPGDYVFGGEALDAVVTQLLGQLEHSGPPPMPRDILNAIPSESVTEQLAAANLSCSVCWDNFQLGEMVSKLECEHMFHSNCITPWLQLHATCPICRRSLLPPDHQGDANIASTTSTTAASTASTTNTSTTSSSTTAASTTNGEVPRPELTPRVVIRRSSHPLFRRAFQTHTWDSPRDMSTSSDSSSSVSVGGLWAPPTRADSATNSSVSVGGLWAPPTRTDSATNSSASANDRTHNYHTDFDCD